MYIYLIIKTPAKAATTSTILQASSSAPLAHTFTPNLTTVQYSKPDFTRAQPMLDFEQDIHVFI